MNAGRGSEPRKNALGAGREVHSFESRVVANDDLGSGYHLLRLDAPEIVASASPGQFLTAALAGTTDPLLGRPLAVFDIGEDRGQLDVLLRIAGRGTGLIARLCEGERLRLVGPLGRGWREEPGRTPVLVAGGTAFAALHWFAMRLAVSGREVLAIWGQKSEADFPVRRESIVPGRMLVSLTTDDGSCGFAGTCLDRLRDAVEKDLRGGRPAIYAAGPVPMLRAVATLARARDIPCQVSIEARMACGIGVCRGCTVNGSGPDPETGLRRRAVCKDGPVFDARDLDWEDLG